MNFFKGKKKEQKNDSNYITVKDVQRPDSVPTGRINEEVKWEAPKD